MFHLNLWLRREKEISMRHLFIVGAAVVAALRINAGIAEAASAPLDGLATSRLPTTDVHYTVGIRRTTEVRVHRTPPPTVPTATSNS